MAALLLVAGFLLYAFHAGAGGRILALFDLGYYGAKYVLHHFFALVRQILLPLIRGLRWAAIVLLVLGAVAFPLINLYVYAGALPGWLVAVAVLDGLLGAAATFWFGRENGSQGGTATIDAGETEVTVALTTPINGPPSVDILPFLKTAEIELISVKANNFTVAVPETGTPPTRVPAPRSIVFNWTVSQEGVIRLMVHVLTASFWPLLIMGCVYFGAGITVEGRLMIALSKPFIVIAFGMFFSMWYFFNMVFEIFGDMLEFVPNSVFALAASAFAGNAARIEQFLTQRVEEGKKRVELIAQKAPEQVRNATLKSLIATLIPLYTLCYFMPTPTMFWVVFFVQFTLSGVYWMYARVAEKDKEWLKAYAEGGVRIYMIICYGLIVWTVATVLFAKQIDWLLNASVPVFGLYGAAFLVLVGFVLAVMAAPRPNCSRQRYWVGSVFSVLGVVLLLVGGSSLFIRLATFDRDEGQADTGSIANGFAASTMNKPNLKPQANGLEITWSDVVGVDYYTIERRLPVETSSSVRTGPGGVVHAFSAKTTSWVDTDVTLGQTYLYRMVAHMKSGKELKSKEESVVYQMTPPPVTTPPPPPSPPPTATATSTTPPKPHKGKATAAACTTCSGTATMDDFCTKHPDLCN